MLPWTEKYRPSIPDEIIYHNTIKKCLKNYLGKDNFPNLLFVGKSGIGKTSTAIAFLKNYYGDYYDENVLMINASEDRGIDAVREKVYGFAAVKNISGFNFKTIILDETDSMTNEAQNILKKIIEKFINSVRFCFICNYIKKINNSILSRCIVLKFNPIPYDFMKHIIIDICNKEDLMITTKALDLTIEYSDGDLRKMINILQSLKMIKQNCDVDNIIRIKNISKLLLTITKYNIDKMFKFIKNNPLNNSINYVKSFILRNDISLSEIVIKMYNYIIDSNIENKDKLICKLAIINENLCYVSRETIQIYSFVSIFYN